jgi:hypothetical protein
VPFRILNDGQKFKRWDWIKYEFVAPAEDMRRESQKVIPESLQVGKPLRKSERARFLNPLVRSSLEDADARGESLALIRPKSLNLSWTEKTPDEIERERRKHAALAAQMSFFDATAAPLDPCPVQFIARWQGVDGKVHRHECDDWETSTAFNRFERTYGRAEAIKVVRTK